MNMNPTEIQDEDLVPPATSPCISLMLSAQIDFALNQLLEYPWYSIYGQICGHGPLATDTIRDGDYTTWHIVNYQVRLTVGPDANEDLAFNSTIIPDIVQSIMQLNTTIPGSICKTSLIVEIKPIPPPPSTKAGSP